MRSKLRWLIGLALLALALTASACGSDDDEESSADGTVAAVPEEFQPVLEPPDDAQEGGDLTMLFSSDIDYMDPGAAYYQPTYIVTNAVHRTLLTYFPDDTDEASADLAVEYPEVSDDDQTVTWTIRDDVTYAPPVDRKVVAADVEYAIERSLLPGVANGYVASYLGAAIGFEAAQKQAEDNPTGGAPDIEGVTAIDDTTLEIRLDQPTAYAVTQMMSLPLSAPVPEEYAKEFDAESPSTYGDYVAFTGPYMVEHAADGELTGYTSGREIQLVRNPNWDPETDERPAYLDSIEIQEGFQDTASAARKILNGSHQVNGDFPPPPTVLKEAATEAEPGQLSVTPQGGNRYIGFNTQEPPFDDINVRKAAVAIADREALRNTRGGELIGPVATHFIPPGVPGFEEAGGLEGTGLDFLAEPNGNPELAAEYMRKAGFESGKCEGADCQLTAVSDDVPPGRDTAEVYNGQLEELGFEVDFRPVDHDIMYSRFCGVPDQQPEVCPNLAWGKDFNDGQSLMDPTFNGENIVPANNVAWTQLDVPEINKAMNEAKLVNGIEERAQAWGEIDTMVTEQAPAVPWTWDSQPNIQSTDVAGVINLFNASFDLAFTSLEG